MSEKACPVVGEGGTVQQMGLGKQHLSLWVEWNFIPISHHVQIINYKWIKYPKGVRAKL